MPNINDLKSAIALFHYYKSLGEKAIEQISDEQLIQTQVEDGNSINILVKHLWGNMLSRWTDFLTSDGEKEWRKRDEEFEDTIKTRTELYLKWNEGWDTLFNALGQLNEKDLTTEITIRGERHRVYDAILRQLAHYAYHIGQIVFISRSLAGNQWQSLSIPKNKSTEYNQVHQGRIKEDGQSIWEK